MDSDEMEGSKRERKGRSGTAASVAALTATVLPATASATPIEGTPAVAFYTVGAVGAVLVVALFAGVALRVAESLRLVGRERRTRVRRRLRICFGVTFLLAVVTPYVALNFSAATLVPFIAAAGLVVAGWVWGASGSHRVDSEVLDSS